MDYGKLYISTRDWQTNVNIVDCEDDTVYFELFGEKCKCNLYSRVVYHNVNGVWEPYDRAAGVTDLHASEISMKRGD